MRRTLATLLLAAGCGGPAADVAPATAPQAIVAGSPSAHAEAVALVTRRSRCVEPEPHLLCTGALVGPDLVLTAAHCLDVFGAEGPYEIFVGAVAGATSAAGPPQPAARSSVASVRLMERR